MVQSKKKTGSQKLMVKTRLDQSQIKLTLYQRFISGGFGKLLSLSSSREYHSRWDFRTEKLQIIVWNQQLIFYFHDCLNTIYQRSFRKLNLKEKAFLCLIKYSESESDWAVGEAEASPGQVKFQDGEMNALVNMLEMFEINHLSLSKIDILRTHLVNISRSNHNVQS
jgi:hypothetical protein